MLNKIDVKAHDRVYTSESAKRNEFFNKFELFPQTRNSRGFLVDGGGFLLNGLAAAGTLVEIPISWMDTALNVSTATCGILGAPLGLYMARDAIKKGGNSLACGDVEGVVHQTLWGTSGLCFTGTGALAATDAIMGLAKVATPALVTSLFGYLGFGMYGTLGLYGAYNLKVASDFIDTLNEVKGKGEQKTIKWLYKQNSLSEMEIAQIFHKSKNPDKEIASQLQRKWCAFDLRTDPECGKLLREKLPALMRNFDPVKAKELIHEVERANYKTRVKSKMFILVALVGFVAFAALSLFTGPFVPVFFALCALLSITIDYSKLQDYIAEKCWATPHLGQ